MTKWETVYVGVSVISLYRSNTKLSPAWFLGLWPGVICLLWTEINSGHIDFRGRPNANVQGEITCRESDMADVSDVYAGSVAWESSPTICRVACGVDVVITKQRSTKASVTRY